MPKTKHPLGLDGDICQFFNTRDSICDGTDSPCCKGSGDIGCLVEIELIRLERHQPSPGGTAMIVPGAGSYIYGI